MKPGLPLDTPACNTLLRQVLGKPWVARAEGPQAWDCYTLLRHADRTLFGRELPPYPVGIAATSPKEVAFAIVSEPFYAGLTHVSEPAHGDYVELCIAGRPVHVGLWLALDRLGGVLHVERGRGVAFDPPAVLETTRYDARYRRPT